MCLPSSMNSSSSSVFHSIPLSLLKEAVSLVCFLFSLFPDSSMNFTAGFSGACTGDSACMWSPFCLSSFLSDRHSSTPVARHHFLFSSQMKENERANTGFIYPGVLLLLKVPRRASRGRKLDLSHLQRSPHYACDLDISTPRARYPPHSSRSISFGSIPSLHIRCFFPMGELLLATLA